MTNEKQQKKSFKWFLGNLKQFVQQYPEKFLAIKDCKILGVYDSFMSALYETEKQGHERGTFLVQHASLSQSITLYNSYISMDYSGKYAKEKK